MLLLRSRVATIPCGHPAIKWLASSFVDHDNRERLSRRGCAALWEALIAKSYYKRVTLFLQEGTRKWYSNHMVTNQKLSLQLNPLDANCPSRRALDLIADKWTSLVIYLLSDGPQRYTHLKRQIGGISQKMLTQTLRKLEEEGLVTRTVYPTAPPSVEYALTPLGETLLEPLMGLLDWAQTFGMQMRSSSTEKTGDRNVGDSS